MAGVLVGGIGLCLVVVLIVIGMPIGVALGLVSIGGIYALLGWAPLVGLLSTAPFDFAASWTLSAIPLFLLMSAVIHQSGIASSIYRAARLWLSFMPGGLAVATNVASSGFAAISGSSMATAAAMGRLAVPEMMRAGYDRGLATGSVASSGTIGALIPPSIMMILYGVFAQVSIARMLIAGIVPGLLTAAVYIFMIIARCKMNPSLAPRIDEHFSKAEKWKALVDIWPLPLLFGGILVGIYSGFVTATEAAALGALLAIVIAVAMGRLSAAKLLLALKETLVSTAQIFFIAIGAVLLTRFLVLSGLPTFLADFFAGLTSNNAIFMIGVSVLYLVLGMFLDPLGVMLISLPILLPIFHSMNANLVWVGVIVVKYVEIGLLTPPVGFNVYVVKSVVSDDIDLFDIFRGVTWFLVCEVVIMGLLIGFPELSLYLPTHYYGP